MGLTARTCPVSFGSEFQLFGCLLKDGRCRSIAKGPPMASNRALLGVAEIRRRSSRRALPRPARAAVSSLPTWSSSSWQRSRRAALDAAAAAAGTILMVWRGNAFIDTCQPRPLPLPPRAYSLPRFAVFRLISVRRQGDRTLSNLKMDIPRLWRHHQGVPCNR